MLDRRLAPFLAILSLFLADAAALLAMGRVAICPCGYVLPWYGPTGTPEANMHLADWYTPSHIIHGFLFYLIIWLAWRRGPFGWRLAAAALVEVGWEIIENTSWTIEHYRTATVSSGYIGDSVVNSLSDLSFMILGFVLARRLPLWASLAICLGLEVLAGVMVRDGLTLNVIMFIYPVDWILRWQTGG